MGGLYLHILKSGTKSWPYNYSFLGKQKTLSIGVIYPAVSLTSTRAKHEEASECLAQGFDPSEIKKGVKAEKLEQVANNFEAVARDWFESFLAKKSKSYCKRVTIYTNNDAFPYIGKTPICNLEPPDVCKVINRIAERGALRHRVLWSC